MDRRAALTALLAAVAGCGGGGGGSNDPADPPAPPPAPQWNPDEIVVIASRHAVDIYLKGSTPSSSRYLRYRMQHARNDGVGAGVWRWSEVWEVERTGGSRFAPILMICNNGEVETAVKQAGKSDYMGGNNHGDEDLLTASMRIDGREVALGDRGTFHCGRVEFTQLSELYEVDTVPAKSTRLALARKRWVFEAPTVELRQSLTWDAAITLQSCFLTMLPLLRTSDGVQISSTGFRSPRFEPEDISSPGFSAVHTPSSVLRATGPNGHSAEVEILEGWDKPNRAANINGSSVYNKFYFDFTGAGYRTAARETMAMRSRFQLDTSN